MSIMLDCTIARMSYVDDDDEKDKIYKKFY